MLGEFECPDLATFLRIFILNRDTLWNGANRTSTISSGISGLLTPINSLSNSTLKISAHYDLSNGMSAALLTEDMTSSCPIYQTERSGKKATHTFYDAQLRKPDHIADQARIK